MSLVAAVLEGVLMKSSTLGCRREFLKTTLAGGMAALIAGRLIRRTMAVATAQIPATNSSAPTKVAVTHGDDRRDNIVRGLKSLEKEIAAAIGNRRVVIKPNLVTVNVPLACSNAGAIAGILDFLKAIGKLENTIIAESSASNTQQGFRSLGFMDLASKYNVKLVDLDQEKYQTVMAFSETDAMPHPVRVSSILANQADNYIISACMLKTHDRAVATMGIKNIVLGSGIKSSGGRGMGRGNNFNDKPILHGGGPHGISINLAMLAPLLHPSLTVIDGFEGMEGNGPSNGTKVDHRVCVVGADYVAADAVGGALMGLDPGSIGYLTYLADAHVGEGDLNKMEIIGEPVAKLAKKYRLSASVQTQFQWKTPASVTPIQ
jgi:uncharacterized protein (DUF362 family)